MTEKTEKKHLTRKNKKEIVQLFKNGNERRQISELTGASYSQVCYALNKAGIYEVERRKKQSANIENATQSKSGTPDYRALYLKAVALLVEHEILEVEL